MNKKVSPAIAQKLAHAYSLFNQGLFKEAEDAATRILKKIPTEPYALNLLGILKLRESDLEPAINALRKAVHLNLNPELLSNLALAYQESGVIERGWAEEEILNSAFAVVITLLLESKPSTSSM